MNYSPDITLGTLLTIGSILLSAGGLLFSFVKFHISNVERFTRIEEAVKNIWPIERLARLETKVEQMWMERHNS